MRKIDENELKKLHNADELLDAKYGAPGTESRRAFDEKARAYYYGVILRDRRKELKMTQKELAEKVGDGTQLHCPGGTRRNRYAAFELPSHCGRVAHQLHACVCVNVIKSWQQFYFG